MPLSIDNDDETSSIDYVAGSVDGIKDPNLRAAAARQSLTGHIGARYHDKESKARDKAFADAVFAQLLDSNYNLNGSYSPYNLHTVTLAPDSPHVDTCQFTIMGSYFALSVHHAHKNGDLVNDPDLGDLFYNPNRFEVDTDHNLLLSFQQPELDEAA